MQHEIKIYTDGGCRHCAATKKYLKEKGIQYKEIDVLKDENGLKELKQLTNAGSLPVITLNGRVIF